MSEEIFISQNLSKKEKYESLLPLLKNLFSEEKNLIANTANLSACLKQVFDFLWVGFYFIEENELVLGPFQGTLACTRIAKGKGVCGTSWQKQKTIIVPNVHEFEGHIACSSLSNSEIVIPFFYHEKLIGVLDIDSENFNQFDEQDEHFLSEILKLIQ